MNAPSNHTFSASLIICSRSAISRKASRLSVGSDLQKSSSTSAPSCSDAGEANRSASAAMRSSLMTSIVPSIEAPASSQGQCRSYDEDAFVNGLLSVNIQKSFDAVSSAINRVRKLDRLITTLVLLAADRMARTPVNVDAGWGALTMELNLAASLRTAQRHGGDRVAAKGLFQAAWQMFADRWLNIPVRPLTAASWRRHARRARRRRGSPGDSQVHRVAQCAGCRPPGAGVSELRDTQEIGCFMRWGESMLWDDTNTQVLPTLRTVFDEWERSSLSDPALGAGHPARYQLLVGPRSLRYGHSHE